MQNVNIESLFKKTGSIYKLAVLASLRAIELSEGAAKLVEGGGNEKFINIALGEIASGKISYKTKEKK